MCSNIYIYVKPVMAIYKITGSFYEMIHSMGLAQYL